MGGTLDVPFALYSPYGCVIVTSVREFGSDDFTCETSNRVSSMDCSKLNVNAPLVCNPDARFHTDTCLRYRCTTFCTNSYASSRSVSKSCSQMNIQSGTPASERSINGPAT